MLLVSGASAGARASFATASQRPGSTLPRRRAGVLGEASSNASPSQAHAIRHGSRAATSPPGRPTVRRCPTRSNPAQVPEQQLPAPDGAVASEPRPVEDHAERRPGLAVLGKHRGQVGVVVLHRHQLHPLALQRIRARQVVGVQVVGDEPGGTANSPSKWMTPERKDAASPSCAGRRCGGETHARSSRATQKVLFSSAPQPRSGRGPRSAVGRSRARSRASVAAASAAARGRSSPCRRGD